MSNADRSPMPKAGVRRVAVIGAGYVGLPTAAILAHHGHQVIIAERDERRLDALRQGHSPIVEHGLDEMLKEGLSTGRLARGAARGRRRRRAPSSSSSASRRPQSEDGSADLSCITAAAAEIAPHLADGAIIVNKSTVPVGTVGLVERVVGRADVVVVSNPEFLREGTAVADSLSPDRVVVGADDREAAASVAELFATRARRSSSPTPRPPSSSSTRRTRSSRRSSPSSTRWRDCARPSAPTCSTSCSASATTSGSASSSCARARVGRLVPPEGHRGARRDLATPPGYDVSIVRGAISGNDDQMRRVVGKIAAAAGGALDGTTIAASRAVLQGEHRRPARLAGDLDHAGCCAEAGATVRAFDPTVELGGRRRGGPRRT